MAIAYDLKDPDVKKAYDIIEQINRLWSKGEIENSQKAVDNKKAGIYWRDEKHKPTPECFQIIRVYLKGKSTLEFLLTRRQYYWAMIFKKLRLGL